MQCRKCGATIAKPKQGTRYCSIKCRPSYKPPRVKYRPQPVSDGWRAVPKLRRSKVGLGFVQAYSRGSNYRIDHYLSLGELPFVALQVRGCHGEIIARFSTLAQAIAACDRHKPANDQLKHNSQGDPIVRSKGH